MSIRRRLWALLAALAVVTTVLTIAPPAAVAVPGPARYPEFWWDRWGVPGLWAAGDRGQGITVAVIDTGVQKIPALAHSLKRGKDFTGLGGDGRTDREIDTFSHGTAMSSIIAARGSSSMMLGPAPNVSILPIAVPLKGVHATVDADETAAAIDYASTHGAKIISMSFGADRSQKYDDEPCPSSTQAAIFRALLKGVLLVASSGNDGLDKSPVADPGVCLGVISVGAADSANHVADFSSRHHYVTVAAPGVRILSLNRHSQLFVGDGTSQAAALTSAALALIWSAHPGESNRQIAARLIAGVQDVGPKGRDTEYGYGLINPGRSAAVRITSKSPNPVFAGADPYLAQLKQGSTVPQAPAAVRAGRSGTAQRGVPPSRSAARRAELGFGVAAVALVVLAAALWPRRRRPAPIPPYPPPTQYAPQPWQQQPTAQWPPPTPPEQWPPS